MSVAVVKFYIGIQRSSSHYLQMQVSNRSGIVAVLFLPLLLFVTGLVLVRLSRFLLLVFIFRLILGDNLGSTGSLLFLELLDLGVSQCLDAVGWARELANPVGDLTSSDERDDDRSADDEGENESVNAIPRGCPTALACTAVGVV